jgi:hypothetical protein
MSALARSARTVTSRVFAQRAMQPSALGASLQQKRNFSGEDDYHPSDYQSKGESLRRPIFMLLCPLFVSHSVLSIVCKSLVAVHTCVLCEPGQPLFRTRTP